MTTTLLALPVEDSTRRQFLAGTAAAGLLIAAGCTTPDAPAPPATRTVTGARGPVEVPVAPQRVAALVGSVDVDVLALGITPVFSGEFAQGWVELPEGVVTNDLVPPDVEVVAATRPDPLLGWEWLADEPAWAQLSQLAPAVPLSEDATWQETFLLVADAVNRRERGEAELAAFDARTAALREQLARWEPIQVAQIGFCAAGTYAHYGQDRETTEIMRSIGLDMAGPPETNQETSVELLGQLTAPWLIVFGSGEDGADGLADAQANPLWATLPAVQAGQVLEVDSGTWTGAGFLWAQALLDDLERLFGDGAPA